MNTDEMYLGDETPAEAARKASELGLKSRCAVGGFYPYRNDEQKADGERILRESAERSALLLTRATGVRHKVVAIKKMDDGSMLTFDARLMPAG